MKSLRFYVLALLAMSLVTISSNAQTYPSPFPLTSGNYTFTQWDNTNAARTYPTSMRFHTLSMTSLVDANLGLSFEPNSDWDTVYNRTSGARVNGRGTLGFSFINTSSSPYAPPRYLGGAVVSINTTNRVNIKVDWTGMTIASTLTGFRNYAIILQYRVGNTGAWSIATGSGGVTDTIQYKSTNPNTGHTQTMPTFTLPAACENQAEVQLRWRYYQWSAATTGNRPELGVDDITIASDISTGIPVQLGIASLIPATPSVLTPFSLTVQAQNGAGLPKNVQTATSIQLTLVNGTGALSGTLSGTIPAGQNSITFNNIMYSVAEQNVRIQATATSGDGLTPAQSSFFTVLPRASAFSVQGIPTNLFVNTTSPVITVSALRSDLSVDANYPGPITITKVSGPGTITGTTSVVPTNGVALFNTIAFDTPGNYVIAVNGSNVTTYTSSIISVVAQPTLVETLFPQYMVSANATTRIPTYALVRFDNLQPNTAYRYAVGADSVPGITGIGAGNNIHYNANQNTLSYNAASRDLMAPGNYSEFVTGAGETSKVLWLNLVATSNVRFTEGKNMYWVVSIRDSSRQIDTRVSSIGFTKALYYGTTTNKLTGIVDSNSRLALKTVICLYDNTAGTGNPLSTAMVQDDGTSMVAAVPYYAALDNTRGAWATVIPNGLPTGVRRVEQRSLITGQIIDFWTDNDGVWDPVNTVNPNGGFTAVGFTTPSIAISTEISGSNFCTNTPTDIKWNARGVGLVHIQISRNGINFTSLVTNVAANLGVYKLSFADSLAGGNGLTIRVIDAARGNVYSISGPFNVNSPAVITRQPSSISPCMGSTATIALTASGSNLTFQWEKDGNPLLGTNTPNLVLTYVTSGSSGLYRCIVNGAAGCSGTSSNAVLVSVQTKVDIAVHPEELVTGIGRTALLSIEATQTTGVTYQWYRGVPGGTTTALTDNNRITGTQSNTLSVRNVQFADLGSDYYCVVTSTCGATTSKFGALKTGTVSISLQPKSQTVCEGGIINLSTAGSSSVGALSYKWLHNNQPLSNGGNVSGATTSTLTVSNATISDTGSYTCLLYSTQSGAQVLSQVASIKITAKPTITKQSGDVTACIGDTKTLSVTSSDANVTYNWIDDKGFSLGGNKADYALAVTSGSQNNTKYRCVISSECGTDTSDYVTVKVVETTVITLQPRSNVKLLEGSTISLTVDATGANVTYQWYKNGTAISGASNQSLSIFNCKASDAGKYMCKVTGDCGIVNSNESLVDIISDVEDTFTSEFRLYQNSPNPAVASTSIIFETNIPASYTVRVTDMLGNDVFNVSLGTVDIGKHTVPCSVQDFPAGVYYYTVSNEHHSLTRKLVVIK